MTEFMKLVAYDWEWLMKDTDTKDKNYVAKLQSYSCGPQIFIPYNGTDSDLIAKIKKYHITKEDKEILSEILNNENKNKKGEADEESDEDMSVDEFGREVEDELYDMGKDLASLFQEIYGCTPKANSKIDFPCVKTCSEIIENKDPARWCMYIGPNPNDTFEEIQNTSEIVMF